MGGKFYTKRFIPREPIVRHLKDHLRGIFNDPLNFYETLQKQFTQKKIFIFTQDANGRQFESTL